MAYFTRPGMGGVTQKLASSLKVPFRQHKNMKRIIKRHEKAHAGEHSLMESMLTVLSVVLPCSTVTIHSLQPLTASHPCSRRCSSQVQAAMLTAQA